VGRGIDHARTRAQLHRAFNHDAITQLQSGYDLDFAASARTGFNRGVGAFSSICTT
jgi:hypothetical protein